MTTVRLRRAAHGLLTLAPDSAPLIIDESPGLDVLVLEVAGGHLSWSLLADQFLPAAVLDDRESAQDWLWAVYGEPVALAVADNHPQELTAAPARPELATSLRRLAYAHWVTRWWPASILDAVPALDAQLVDHEIAALTEACEMALGDPPASSDSEQQGWPIESGTRQPAARRDGDGRADSGTQDGPGWMRGGAAAKGPASEQRARAEDYALAAGGVEATRGGLVLARGSGGWDWRRCPPGIVDASEQAVSWQVTRAGGVSTVRVSVVAAPDCTRGVPEHLWPHARVTAPRVSDSGGGSECYTAPLQLHGDAWIGTVQIPTASETGCAVTIFVPGVGPESTRGDESPMRARIRAYVRRRLAGNADDPLLIAEASAAGGDQDF
ncbi:hypothetical protein [Nocardia mangyaensis]|uniref:hypothetical protein n=1 Tax=Nocardia mangyaensis TaxID=2213200 RepID=UPI002676E4AF|nr:hypothetical protein [Nocardia mangyaensis]MDO3649433.1 hypothetical protein [Nocardia mangyaensis]